MATRKPQTNTNSQDPNRFQGYPDEESYETLLDALDKRNLLSHTYRKALALEAETLIKVCYRCILARLHATLQAKRQA